MTPRLLLSRFFLPFLLVAACCSSLSEAVEPPQLRLEAPDELASVAARLSTQDPRRLETAMRFLGLEESGAPIQIVLSDEASPAALATPGWIAGYAYGNLGVVVIFPERTPAYPHSSLEEVLYHELAHVLASRAAGGRRLPRWFGEGVALHVGRSWTLEDRSRTTWALLTEGDVRLSELEQKFSGNQGEVRRAYALSGAFVRDLLQHYGQGVVSRVLSAVALGSPFEEAFQQATGLTLHRAEESFWKRYSFWYRWMPVITSSATIWTGITLLALWAFKRRRQRDAEIRKMWEEEERWLDGDSEDFSPR